MTLTERNKLIAMLHNTEVTIDCKSCEHFSDNFCSLYELRPPEHIIEKGCGEGVEAIPF